MPTGIEYLKTFLIAGTTVTGISYLGNSVNPLLAGILAGIPIGMPSMLLIRDMANRKQFISYTSATMVILSMVTILCWYLYTQAKYSAKISVFISMLVWLLGGVIYYFYITSQRN